MREMEFAYFDNAATTYKKPAEVHSFMHDFYACNSVNISRGKHILLTDGQRIITETREMLVSLFHGTSEYTAVLTPSATEALNIIIQGQEWIEGQNIYISPFEHNAVIRTIKYLEQKKGINVFELSVDRESLQFSFDRIRKQFSENKPAMVIVTHISNVCGNINPIEKLGVVAKEFGATYVVDCAQSAGLLTTDIIKAKADYMVFAGHKTLYGPFGCSGFVCKKNVNLNPLIYGGVGIDSLNWDMPSEVPQRFEAGSYNILSIAGLYAALKWNQQIGINNIFDKEKENFQKLYNIIKNIEEIQVIGNINNSCSIISCLIKGLPVDATENILSQNGIIVRAGLHCAPLAHRFLNTLPEGTVRFSVSYFTDDKDFDLLRKVLKRIVTEL